MPSLGDVFSGGVSEETDFVIYFVLPVVKSLLPTRGDSQLISMLLFAKFSSTRAFTYSHFTKLLPAVGNNHLSMILFIFKCIQRWVTKIL